jgi:hypothetical protein
MARQPRAGPQECVGRSAYERKGIYKEAQLKQRQNEFRIEVFGLAWLDGLEQDHRSVLGEVTRTKDRHSKNLTRT